MHLPQKAGGNVYYEQEVLFLKEGVHCSILVLYTDVNSQRGKINLLARKSLDTFQSLFNHIAKACNYYETHVYLHPTSLVPIFALNISVEYYNQNIYIFDNPFFCTQGNGINTYTANVCNSVQYMQKTSTIQLSTNMVFFSFRN